MDSEFYIFLAFVAVIFGIMGYRMGPKRRAAVKDFADELAEELTNAETFRENRWHLHISIGAALGFFGVLIGGKWFGMLSEYDPWIAHIWILLLTGAGGSMAWEVGQAIKQGHFQDRRANFKALGDIVITTAAFTVGGAIACALFIWVA